MKSFRAARLASLLLALAGCSTLTPAERGPRPNPVARLAPAGPSPWREDFGDPVLRDLIREADLGALQIKTALARLEQADAEAERAKAGAAPRVNGGLIAATGSRTFRDRTRGAVTPTLEATYEIDLRGRLARARDAAGSDRIAAAADVAAARLLIAAETARAYAALRLAQEEQTAAAERVGSAERAVALTQQRAAAGAALGREIESRRAAVRAAAELASQAREEVELQSARIAALTGKTGYAAGPGQPLALAPSPSALPSGVVEQRPDVQAALARLAAADQRRAEAIAAAQPKFEIELGLGSPEAALVTLLDVKSLAWVAAANLTQPLLDGGARRANLHAAAADADVADIAYRQVVLTAWTELRAAGVAEARARRAVTASETAIAAARSAAQAGDLRRQAGTADGLAVLDLGLAVQEAEDAARQARSQQIEARIALTLAKGGG